MAWLYKRGGKWWIGWRLNGKQFLEPTGESDKQEAVKHLARLNAVKVAQASNALSDQFYEALTGKKVERITAFKFMGDWLAESEAETTHSTMLKYRQVVREFSKYAGIESRGLMLDDISANDVSAFLADCRKRLAPGTVKGYRRILGSIFHQAHNRGLTKGNPVALVKVRGKAKANEKTQKRPFTVAELKTLHDKATPFWKYMIEAGYFTGQSLGDLITLKAESVNLGRGIITMNRRKTGRQVIIPICPALNAVLQDHWPKGGKGYFWPEQAARYERVKSSAFSQEFHALMAECGLVKAREDKQSKGNGRGTKRELSGLGFHNVRHTFVTALKVGGAVDSVAKELAGHGSDAVSAVYTHLPIETLSKAVAQIPQFTDHLQQD